MDFNKSTCVDEGFALRRRDFSLCSSGVILVLLSWISSGGVGSPCSVRGRIARGGSSTLL